MLSLVISVNIGLREGIKDWLENILRILARREMVDRCWMRDLRECQSTKEELGLFEWLDVTL